MLVFFNRIKISTDLYPTNTIANVDSLPTYNRGSQHDPKAPEEHEDAVGLSQFVQANDLSGNVGGERPVSREETQDEGQDLKSQITLSERDKEQCQTSSKHGEGIQKDAINPLDVHQHTQQQFTSTRGDSPY